jgi:hypothetical protein
MENNTYFVSTPLDTWYKVEALTPIIAWFECLTNDDIPVYAWTPEEFTQKLKFNDKLIATDIPQVIRLINFKKCVDK